MTNRWLFTVAILNAIITSYYAVIRPDQMIAPIAVTTFDTAEKMMKAGQIDEAIKNYEIIVDDYPPTAYTAEAAYELSRIFLRRNIDPAKAREYLEVVGKYPESKHAKKASADLMFINDNWDNNGKPLTFWYEAIVAKRAGNLSGAAEALRRLVADFPEAKLAPKALYQLAEIRKKSGDGNGAAAAYRDLVARFPGHPDAIKARKALE